MSKINQNILQHYKGNEEFVKRIYDYLDYVDRRNIAILTPFFSEEQAAIFKKIVGKMYEYIEYGGYEGASRVRFLIMPYEYDDIDMEIVCLKANVSKQYANITHSDVLGAVLNLGIEREKIGDFIIEEDSIMILVDQSIETYIIANLNKIKRSNVIFKRYDGNIVNEIKIEYHNIIVSSMRLDVIVSHIAHVSRAKAQMMIKAKFVKVNQVVLEEIAHLCDNDNVLSIKGYGRFIINDIVKKTKKDHFILEIGKYC